MSNQVNPKASNTKRVTFRKVETDGSSKSTYEVLLDGTVIGTVSKVRENYLRRLGGHRGNNVPASRTAWIVNGVRGYHDSRDEAAIDLVSDTQNIEYGAALDIVHAKG